MQQNALITTAKKEEALQEEIQSLHLGKVVEGLDKGGVMETFRLMETV